MLYLDQILQKSRILNCHKFEFMYCIISTTTDSKEIIDKISNSLIKSGYSPCIQVIDNIKSIYKWNDKIEKSIEYKMIIKSIDKHSDNIVKIIKSLHNYEVAEIIKYDISIENNVYENWFLENINK